MAIKRTKYCGYKPCHKPIKSGEFCSIECGRLKRLGQMVKPHTPLKRSVIKKKFYAPGTAKPANKIRPLSKKRAKQNQLYLQLRAAFLVNKICPITKEPATEVHHKKGRCGALLTDVRFFLAVSRRGHVWIETHPAEAEKLGYVIKRTTKTE